MLITRDLSQEFNPWPHLVLESLINFTVKYMNK